MSPHATADHLPAHAYARSGYYDPWLDVRLNWPEVQVLVEPMAGDLLGEVREDGCVIALRAGTSGAQRRCTLTHEIIHLERGILDCGPWLHREELAVHTTTARRLLPMPMLISAIRDLGGAADLPALAHALDVDGETLQLRLERLNPTERRQLRRALARQAPLWTVA